MSTIPREFISNLKTLLSYLKKETNIFYGSNSVGSCFPTSESWTVWSDWLKHLKSGKSGKSCPTGAERDKLCEHINALFNDSSKKFYISDNLVLTTLEEFQTHVQNDLRSIFKILKLGPPDVFTSTLQEADSGRIMSAIYDTETNSENNSENKSYRTVKEAYNRLLSLFSLPLQNEESVEQPEASNFSLPQFTIFHGSPGTGKTTKAKQHASEKNWKEKIIQIHPSYSYEDLIEGLKPVTFEDGILRYEVVEGPVRIEAHKASNKSPVRLITKIIKTADNKYMCTLPVGTSQRYGFSNVLVSQTQDSKTIKIHGTIGDRFELDLSKNDDSQHIDLKFQKEGYLYLYYRDTTWGNGSERVLILDEINRGNIAQMFGELLFAIAEQESNDSTKKGVDLQYSGESFIWPARLHLIGTMNSADTSTDRLDQAIKRRFKMEQCLPNATLLMVSNESFGFLNNANARAKLKDLKEKASIDELFVICKSEKASKILINLNEALKTRKEIIHVGDKLLGHSYFIRLARQIIEAISVQNDECQTSAFWECVSIFAQDIAPALQNVFNHDENALRSFFEDLCGEDKLKSVSDKSILDEEFQACFVGHYLFKGFIAERRKNNVHRLPDSRAAA